MTTTNTIEAPDAPTPQPVVAAKKSWARFITPVLALVAALVIGFFGGLLVGQNSGSGNGGQSGFPGNMGEMPGGGTGGPSGMGGATSGTISSIDGDSITLTLADGSTVTVTTTGDTSVTATEQSSVSQLSEGDTITVLGESDADGNVAADSISEGQSLGFGGGAGAERPSN